MDRDKMNRPLRQPIMGKPFHLLYDIIGSAVAGAGIVTYMARESDSMLAYAAIGGGFGLIAGLVKSYVTSRSIEKTARYNSEPSNLTLKDGGRIIVLSRDRRQVSFVPSGNGEYEKRDGRSFKDELIARKRQQD